MSEPTLADLVYERRLEQAIELGGQLNPKEVYNRLLRDDDRHLHDEAPIDEFLRRWFETLKSPYLRAEAADCFTSTYTTQLAPVPNAEYIGAYMRTASLRELIKKIADAILGPELKDLEETPDHPLTAESAVKWRGVGKILADLDLPPAVSPIAPQETGTA